MSSVSPRKQPLVQREASTSMNDNEGGFSWLTALGFGFLTFNSGMAIYRSDGDRGSVAFVLTSYIDLVLLFACLRLFEKAPRDSARREWLKVFVWGLTTLLTVMFSYKVAAIMPPVVAVIVWAMAFATIGGGFYAFFVHQDKAAQLEQANR
ncbi:uncharacterized protein [Oryza sativa Japonica Group]|uniref:Os06g0580100 protein n=4 Tax=cellular organisms TaxID=131567 RepID=A0A0P0WY18_ORYSJ|nr:uncharacterized protein LOC4341377 [Oryza sativa Japonica Group]EEE65928.1 hypothetical protein OsJ_21791 [Oryza sativa Japonica Group]BAD68600.1 unknown protein [Oryza sativa Japonica Group]BAF19850.1 Os06g0580100 [Oryza sativa Japonica Group]BAS98368.1 Os06g0580100 [Oryza sativa Japonica Group]|eukprot:NP_001057936.1 Os06g0580100 [Oryza sativa Japonica Group]